MANRRYLWVVEFSTDCGKTWTAYVDGYGNKAEAKKNARECRSERRPEERYRVVKYVPEVERGS